MKRGKRAVAVDRLPAAVRPAEAVPAAEEAVATYRELAAADPGRYRSGLADALTALSLAFLAQGRPAEARAAAQEGLAIRLELTAADPGLARMDVAFAGLGPPAGLPAQEGTDRERAAAGPGPYRPDLAVGLISVAIRLLELAERAMRCPSPRQPSLPTARWPPKAPTATGRTSLVPCPTSASRWRRRAIRRRRYPPCRKASPFTGNWPPRVPTATGRTSLVPCPTSAACW